MPIGGQLNLGVIAYGSVENETAPRAAKIVGRFPLSPQFASVRAGSLDKDFA